MSISSEFSSASLLRVCRDTIASILDRLTIKMEDDCLNLREAQILDTLQDRLREMANSLSALQRRDILFTGRNNEGKTFLLNLLFFLTCVDFDTYKGRDFKEARRNMMEKFKDAGSLVPMSSAQDVESGPLLYVCAGKIDSICGLEALLQPDILGPIRVVTESPESVFHGEGLRIFKEEPEAEYNYLMQRFTGFSLLFGPLNFRLKNFGCAGYSQRLELKENTPGNLKPFPSFCQKSGNDGGATTFFSTKLTFGNTFHTAVEFYSEKEILQLAQFWVDVVKLSIEEAAKRDDLDGDEAKFQYSLGIRDDEKYRIYQDRFMELFDKELTSRVAKAIDIASLPSRSEMKESLRSDVSMLARQGKIFIAGTGENIHRDRMYVLQRYVSMFEKGVARYMMKAVQTHVPSQFLASGCSVTDAPGIDDAHPLHKAAVRQALQEHDIVIALCSRNVEQTESVLNFIFDGKEFGFPSRFLKDPEGKHFVVMQYVEKADTEGIACSILDGKIERYWIDAEKRRVLNEKQIMQRFQKVIRLLSLPTKLSEVASNKTLVLSVFPVLFASLTLNGGKYLADVHMMESIIKCTCGHQFFALPEILNQAELREKVDFLRSFLGKQIEESEAAPVLPTVSFSAEAIRNIDEMYARRAQTKMREQNARAIKDLLDRMGVDRGKFEGREFSIDTLLGNFEGEMISKLAEKFNQFKREMGSFVPKIEESFKKFFMDLKENAEEEADLNLKLIQIFNNTNGISETIDLTEYLVGPIDSAIQKSVSEPRGSAERNFDFGFMLGELRKDLLNLLDFIAERIKDVIFQNLCSSNPAEKNEDMKGMDSLYGEYMKTGKKSLQERIMKALELMVPNKVSKYPDYDFLSDCIKAIGRDQVMQRLEEISQGQLPWNDRHTSFLAGVPAMLENVLDSLHDRLQATFREAILTLKYDFVEALGRSKKPFHDRFTHSFLFKFIRRLKNSIDQTSLGWMRTTPS